MKKIIISVITVLFFLSPLLGQCKYKTSGGYFSFVKNHTEISPETITKPKPLFTKFNTAGTQFFIKSNDGIDYFGFIFNSDISKKFKVLLSDPLIIMLAGDQDVKLYPTTNYEG